jgi:hypothetical protein
MRYTSDIEPPDQTTRNVAFFIALMATAVALGGALAHALELPNKIALPREHYLIVQHIYDGWNQLAYVLAVQLTALLTLIWLYWRETRVARFVVLALVALIAAQIVFWMFTYPANVATGQWTVLPENWQQLRTQWEYSHLAGALFQLLAMTSLVVAVLRRR